MSTSQSCKSEDHFGPEKWSCNYADERHEVVDDKGSINVDPSTDQRYLRIITCIEIRCEQKYTSWLQPRLQMVAAFAAMCRWGYCRSASLRISSNANSDRSQWTSLCLKSTVWYAIAQTASEDPEVSLRMLSWFQRKTYWSLETLIPIAPTPTRAQASPCTEACVLSAGVQWGLLKGMRQISGAYSMGCLQTKLTCPSRSWSCSEAKHVNGLGRWERMWKRLSRMMRKRDRHSSLPSR